MCLCVKPPLSCSMVQNWICFTVAVKILLCRDDASTIWTNDAHKEWPCVHSYSRYIYCCFHRPPKILELSLPPSRLQGLPRSAGRTGSCTQKPRRRSSSGPSWCCAWYQTAPGRSPWAAPLQDTNTVFCWVACRQKRPNVRLLFKQNTSVFKQSNLILKYNWLYHTK